MALSCCPLHLIKQNCFLWVLFWYMFTWTGWTGFTSLFSCETRWLFYCVPWLSVIIPRCYEDVHVNSFFPHKAKLWNTLPEECLTLTCDLNDLTDTFQLCVLAKNFPVCFSSFSSSFSCKSMPFSGCSALHGVNPCKLTTSYQTWWSIKI